MVKSLACPALPLRCSDRCEYSSLPGLKDLKKNLTFILSTRLYWSAAGRRTLELDLAGEDESPFFPRGIYKIEKHCLKIRDWCGFFEYSLEADQGGRITVYPASGYMERGIPVHRNSIPEKRTFISWLKDREFFDARPYAPGDDPRRINWKMLARHDELFIREGNSLSPSKKSALLLFDASAPSGETDYMFRRFSALSAQLSEAGLLLTALLPGKEPIQGLEKYSKSEREDLYASVPPLPLTEFRAPGDLRYGIVYFFSGKLPEMAALKSLDLLLGDARKNLVLPRTVKIQKKDNTGGWNIVQA